MSTPDTYLQALRDLLVADHEECIAEAQRWADEAAAEGNAWSHRLNLDRVARLKAMTYPWEQPAA